MNFKINLNMARREFIEGTWSRQYEYVEICRDDNSCKKRFKWREEEDLAEEYYTHLQSLDDQANTYREQKRTADELEALRKATEEKNRRDRERPFRPPFPQSTRQVLDPEYQEWLEFKKATDPEFLKWKQKKQEAKRKAEEERIRAEQARIKAEQERQKKAEEERRKKEAELRPYEEDILNKKKVPCHLRVKVAKETYREEVMLRCVRDSAVSVFNALKQNPNLTYKVRDAIQKKEYHPPIPTTTSTPSTSSPTPSEPESGGSGCLWFIIVLCVVGFLITIISNG